MHTALEVIITRGCRGLWSCFSRLSTPGAAGHQPKRPLPPGHSQESNSHRVATPDFGAPSIGQQIRIDFYPFYCLWLKWIFKTNFFFKYFSEYRKIPQLISWNTWSHREHCFLSGLVGCCQSTKVQLSWFTHHIFLQCWNPRVHICAQNQYVLNERHGSGMNIKGPCFSAFWYSSWYSV